VIQNRLADRARDSQYAVAIFGALEVSRKDASVGCAPRVIVFYRTADGHCGNVFYVAPRFI
jgi:hypothetical protein